MNLFDYFKEKIHMEKIESFSEDTYDMAIVRYVMKEASKIFYRDYTFFLDKENIKAREDIYDKKIDLTNIEEFAIICKSYCNIIQELLKQNYGIDSELISTCDDRFRHVDLLIKTKNGNRYIVDPLTDLIEMQVGLRTNNFASKNHYDSLYAGIVENISFLNDKELEQIDNRIDYKIDGTYLDDFFDLIKVKFNNIEETLQKNELILINLLGKKNYGRKLSDDEKTDLKLKFISKYINNRKHINGMVDLLMFFNITIEKLFSKEEREKIHSYSFFVDEKDLKNNNLSSILTNKENRKRGVAISFNGKNYVFSLNPNSLEYDDEEWKKIVEENNIFIKPQYPVKLLKYLKKQRRR